MFCEIPNYVLQNFQSILESSLDDLESRGLQNMLVKYEEFETKNKGKVYLSLEHQTLK